MNTWSLELDGLGLMSWCCHWFSWYGAWDTVDAQWNANFFPFSSQVYLLPSTCEYRAKSLQMLCATESPGGLVKTDSWDPAPEFLIQCVCMGPHFVFLTSSHVVPKLFPCGPHFDIDGDIEQIVLSAGGQSLQHLGPLFGFWSKALLKYINWDSLTYSDTDHDNMLDFYSQVYLVLILCSSTYCFGMQSSAWNQKEQEND